MIPIWFLSTSSMNTFDWRIWFVLVKLGSAVTVKQFSFPVDIIIRVFVFRSENKSNTWVAKNLTVNRFQMSAHKKAHKKFTLIEKWPSAIFESVAKYFEIFTRYLRDINEYYANLCKPSMFEQVQNNMLHNFS